MKQLLLFFLVFFNAVSFGQSFEKIIDSTKIWVTLMSCGPPGCLLQSTFQKFSGDTIIGTQHFIKYYKSNDSLMMQFIHSGYVCEDTDSKVYFRNITGTQNYLIYDFQAEAGDTLNIWGANLIVDTIDSVQIGGSLRKRLKLHPEFSGYQEYWIEGIGSKQGVLYGYTVGYVGCGYRLQCYFKNDTLLYHNDDAVYCYPFPIDNCYINYVGISEPERLVPKLCIMPNPVTTNSIVQIKSNDQKDNAFDVYDLLGAKVGKVSTNNNSQIIIRKSDFKSGMYFIRGKIEGLDVFEKFIVQ
jgi:hypothetical protein